MEETRMFFEEYHQEGLEDGTLEKIREALEYMGSDENKDKPENIDAHVFLEGARYAMKALFQHH